MDPDPVREAKEKLRRKMKAHEGKFAVGIGPGGSVEVRLYDASIENEFPSEIDGVPVRVQITTFPKPR